MRRLTMVAIAVGLSLALSTPILGLGVAARTIDPLTVTVLPPVKDRTFWYGGAVMPVKVLVTDPDDNESPVAGANVTLWVNENPATGPGNSQMGNTFRDLGGGYYQYNLDTKPYPAGPGTAPIIVLIMVIAPEDHEDDATVIMPLH